MNILKIKTILLIAALAAFGLVGCESEWKTEYNLQAKLTKIAEHGSNPIYVFEYDGKTYIVPYKGGIIEHKAD